MTTQTAEASQQLTENTRDTLIRYIDAFMDEKKAGLLLMLFNGTLLDNLDRERMKELGFTSFDWAKPAELMNAARKLVSSETLEFTVMDYTESRVWGRVESVAVRLLKHIIEELRY